MKHYKYGSSTAARTNNCQAWPELSEGMPRKESPAALRGTRIHHALEHLALGLTIDAACKAGKVVEEADVELVREMWQAALAVMDDLCIDDFEPEVTGEASPLIGGTLDLVGRTRDGKTVMLLDHKTGQGVQVDAEGNEQVLFAAAVGGLDSCVSDWFKEADRFVGVIIQPGRNGEVQTKTWTFTPNVVDAWWAEHINNIALAEAKGAEPVAGDHCKFCPAAGVCPAKTGQIHRLLQLDPRKMDDLAAGLALIPSVTDTIRAMEKLAFEQLEVGQQVPGYKLVRKRSTRRWADTEAALKALRAALRGVKLDEEAATKALLEPAKLKSPAQVEKLLKKTARDGTIDIADLTVQPPGDLTLAPEDDKREGVPAVQALKQAMAQVA